MIARLQGYNKLILIVLIISSSFAQGGDNSPAIYKFNDGFIVGSREKVDLSRFSSTAISDGTYSLDVYTNGQWKGRYDLDVKADAEGQSGICYTAAMLTDFGITPDKLNPELSQRDNYCGPLRAWRNDSLVNDKLVESALRLNITVPQIYENRLQQSYVRPEFWDKGIAALNIGWMANTWTSHVSGRGGSDSSSAYLGLNSALTWDGWLLKHIGNLNWQQDGGSVEWNSNQTYLQRPVPAIKAIMKGGQIFTSGEFFDTVGIRGVNLSTDDNMTPDGMRSYAPEIRGIAQSNALVTIRQGENIIYQTTVSPGPFIINDVFPSGYGSDLVVTVKESDGSEQIFSVPYSSVAQLLRPGMSRFSLSAGKADDDILSNNKPVIYQATWQEGINNYFTGYSGITGFNDYQALILGSAMNTSLGALSFDVTHSRLNSDDLNESGNSYRATFNRMFSETDTSIVLAAYRYSTEGYYNINDALYTIEQEKRNNRNEFSVWRQKNGINFSINQKLASGWGGFFVNGSINDYWNRQGTEKQFQVNYNNNFGRLSWALSAQRVYQTVNNAAGSHDDRISLNLSYPLWFGEERSANLTSNTIFNNSKFGSAQVGVNGSLDKENNMYYGVSSTAVTGGQNDVAISGGYRTPSATLNGNYSQGQGYRQGSLGASGTLLAHQQGIVFSPETGNTLALIEAKDAVGASLTGSPGTRIDKQGYAILPYMQPYRVNSVEIDPKGSEDNVVFNNTISQVVPWENSVVKVSFETSLQDNLIFRALRADKRPLPFAANIYNPAGKEVGVVGQGSTLYINDASANTAIVKWNGGQCSVSLTHKDIKETICR